MSRTLKPPQSWLFADDELCVEELTRRDRADLLRFGYDALILRLRKRAAAAFAACLLLLAAAILTLDPPLLGLLLMFGAGLCLCGCAHQLSRVRRLLSLMVLDLHPDGDGFDVLQSRSDGAA